MLSSFSPDFVDHFKFIVAVSSTTVFIHTLTTCCLTYSCCIFHFFYPGECSFSSGSCSIAHSPTWNQNLWLTQSLSGTISSPGYPASIGQPIQCYWKILVPIGYTIKLSFEVYLLPSSCKYTCLRIYNGLDSSKTLLANLSGGGYAQTFFSSGRSMLLKFEGNSDMTYMGNCKFKASYAGLKTSKV